MKGYRRVSGPFRLAEGREIQGNKCSLWFGDLYNKQAAVIRIPKSIVRFVWDVVECKFQTVIPHKTTYLVWHQYQRGDSIVVNDDIIDDALRTFRIVNYFMGLRSGGE